MTEVVQPPLYKLLVEFPFPTKRYAQIIYDVLRVDAEPRRSQVTKNLTVEENVLKAQFFSFDARNLRVGVSSFFEHLLLASETVEEFGPPTSEEYSHY